MALHEALEQLADHDPVKARLVELRFFGGLTLVQAAECLNISLSTADRAWRYARAWLYAAMADAEPPGKTESRPTCSRPSRRMEITDTTARLRDSEPE
jgi:hypothetical protein